VLKSVIWFAFLRRVETKEGEGGENIWVIREMVGVGVVAWVGVGIGVGEAEKTVLAGFCPQG